MPRRPGSESSWAESCHVSGDTDVTGEVEDGRQTADDPREKSACSVLRPLQGNRMWRSGAAFSTSPRKRGEVGAKRRVRGPCRESELVEGRGGAGARQP